MTQAHQNVAHKHEDIEKFIQRTNKVEMNEDVQILELPIAQLLKLIKINKKSNINGKTVMIDLPMVQKNLIQLISIFPVPKTDLTHVPKMNISQIILNNNANVYAVWSNIIDKQKIN
ncbi:hypothetical protein PVAND_017706 [Polypedilum vanderplanki]|uniref:Uncharacterized protein n=1 Tax=Polypedilum vanderplanki TaxID=319348 RepID=A0A9J6B8R4_POLVA|nr:hypothetical protein PVAND_017706 [Polypedilum vanderplanki]